jgi:hypothetical protein
MEKTRIARMLFLTTFALGTAASAAKADCDIKDFLVKDVVSLNQSGSTQLAFVLTATESQYDNAKKNMDTGADVFGLFSGNLNYGQAEEKAHQIAQATKFNYDSSYASSYLSQTVSGKALDDYIACLQNDKNSPGLRLWVNSTSGIYSTINGFWVGANTLTPSAKYDAPPIIDGGTLIGQPDEWVKGQTYPFAVKSGSKDGFYLNMKVGGEPNTLIVVPKPPEVIWLKQPVVSSKKLSAASTYSNPCTATSDSDTIYPLHPGGYFVSGTRTINRSTTDAGHYGEQFTVDRPNQVSVTMTQSTGACELRQFATGQLQAIETYPQASQ